MKSVPVRFAVLFMVCLLAGAACSRGAGEGGFSSGRSYDFTTLSGMIKPSVVNITALEIGQGALPGILDRFFGRRSAPAAEERQGSGVIVKSTGLILTSYHLVEKAGRIRVTTTDGRTWPAEMVKGDARRDLALIRVKPKTPLKPAPLGNSRGLQVGEWVMAVGNPFGYENTITVGVVSALDRQDVAEGLRVGLVQTDASINPGNDGGPLVNIRGEVVGINTALSTEGRGINFAVPINEAKSLFEDFI
jgi:serine protease Do